MNQRPSIVAIREPISFCTISVRNLRDVQKIVTLFPRVEKEREEESQDRKRQRRRESIVFCDDTQLWLIVERINERHTVGSSGFGWFANRSFNRTDTILPLYFIPFLFPPSEASKIRTIFLDNDDQILNDENYILTFRNVRVIFTQISKLSLEIRECNWSLEGCKVCYKACLFLKIR